MRYCTHCGHRLGVGRYCTNCGAQTDAPVPDAHTDPDLTSVRLPPVQPPVPASVPPAARYPLYADSARPAPQAAPSGAAPTTPPSTPPPTTPAPVAGRRRGSALVWIGGLAALLVLALVGLVLLVTGDGDEPAVAGADPAQTTGGGKRDRSADGDDRPDDSGSGLAGPVEVDVPATAAASTDNDGNRVTYVAGNMLDGDPRTAWRMAGDGTGQVLTFTFDSPVEIASVGMVNGYAKNDPPNNWYDGNRRILVVSWLFDDGTEVTQDLREEPTLQTTDVGPVETSSVQLRVLEVSKPGRGPSGRDFTAISEVAFEGS